MVYLALSFDHRIIDGAVADQFMGRLKSRIEKWDVGGPHFAGRSVYAMAYDGREGRHRIWAAPKSLHWGAELCASDDFGRRTVVAGHHNDVHILSVQSGNGGAGRFFYRIAKRDSHRNEGAHATASVIAIAPGIGHARGIGHFGHNWPRLGTI